MKNIQMLNMGQLDTAMCYQKETKNQYLIYGRKLIFNIILCSFKMYADTRKYNRFLK